MKLTFERATIEEIVNDMWNVLAMLEAAPPKSSALKPATNGLDTEIEAPAEIEAPGDLPETPPAPVAKARAPKVEAPEPKATAKKAKTPVAKSGGSDPDPDLTNIIDLPAPKAQAKPLDPAELVAIRQKTIEDLQAAYANGQQKEVFALLQKYGNGAKSFRELSVDAFVPIREAIDQGALA